MSRVRTVGIVGAGKLGIVLAQLSLRSGYGVVISGSGDPEKIRLSVETLAPGAVAVTTSDVAERADIIILAMPLKNYKTLDPGMFEGKLVVDAMNYWWETDGDIGDILPGGLTQSEAVQAHLVGARLVKALNHMGYHHLLDAVDNAAVLGHRAIAIAGDDASDVGLVAAFVDSLGLNPLPIGELSSGVSLEPGHPAFGAHVSLAELSELLAVDDR